LAANRAAGECDKGKVTLIGGPKPVRKDSVAHTKSRQRLEQDVIIGSIPDPWTELVKVAQDNIVLEQSSVEIGRLRREELTVFIGSGNAMNPKVVHGCIAGCGIHHSGAMKFAAHAQADGLAKIVKELRLVRKWHLEIRGRYVGGVNRGCR